MESKELKKYLKRMESFKRKVTSSKKASRKFLLEMGVITKNGNLKRKYSDLSLGTKPSLLR